MKYGGLPDVKAGEGKPFRPARRNRLIQSDEEQMSVHPIYHNMIPLISKKAGEGSVEAAYVLHTHVADVHRR